jgi:uncharacterized protein YqhQ
MVIDVNRLYALKELIIRNGGPLPIGLSTLYAAVHKGLIPAKRIGRRIFVPGWYLNELVMKQVTGNNFNAAIKALTSTIKAHDAVAELHVNESNFKTVTSAPQVDTSL